ncbi:MAG: tetratricopeptide repeat protein [Acidobacteriota bacterium]
MRVRSSSVTGLVLALSMAAVTVRAAYPPKPLDRVQVLALMDFGESSFRVVQLIHRAGIGFAPTADDLKLFKDLGATPALLDAIEHAKPEMKLSSAPNADEQAAFAHLSSCMTLASKGKFADAAKECEAATNFEPGATYFALGDVYLHGRQLKEAIEALKKAGKADPGNPDTRNYLGLALGESGKTKEAKKEFETAIQLDPDFDTPHNNLAGYYLQKNDLDTAKSELLAALKINPDSPSAHGNLGVVLARQNDLTGSIAELQKALDLDPTSPFRYGSNIIRPRPWPNANLRARMLRTTRWYGNSADRLTVLPARSSSTHRRRRVTHLCISSPSVKCPRARPAGLVNSRSN